MERTYYLHTESKMRKYVIQTVEERNTLYEDIQKNRNNWIDKFITLANHYYEQEPVGGCLHIVLDDENIDDISISYCQGYAMGIEDYEAVDLADFLLCMTMKQRKKAMKLFWNQGGK